jgi:hypothetical protein
MNPEPPITFDDRQAADCYARSYYVRLRGATCEDVSVAVLNENNEIIYIMDEEADLVNIYLFDEVL